MVQPIPDNVKEVLSSLSAQQQVVLRAYIASLREEIKEAEHKDVAASDPDPHAHYHGHEKCTSDHSHDHSHKEENHEHSHEHGDTCCTEDHSHEVHGHDHSHAENHDHGHSHKEPHHSHEHSHAEDDMPAWKKKALEADPMAAPFGGNWNTEASLSATDDKMKE